MCYNSSFGGIMPNKQEEIEAIKLNIIKYHLSNFCKRNSRTLGLLFKALIQSEKTNHIQKTANHTTPPNTKTSPKSSTKKTQTNQNTPNKTDTIHLEELKLDIPTPKPPLNIEG